MKLPKDPDWKKKDRDLAARARAIRAPRGFKVPGDRLQFSDRRYVVAADGSYRRVEMHKP